MLDGTDKMPQKFTKRGKAMDTGREQIDLFLRRCDEVMQSKFIIAESKISELLKSIATSDLLYAFFRDLTKDFDYAAAKRRYLHYAPDSSQKNRLLFPDDPAEMLAFIFCLLVDIDNRDPDLSDFLQRYFYEDGSFYESFYAFCNQVIKPFKNAVKVMFRHGVFRASSDRRVSFAPLVAAERDSVYASRLSDADKVDALLILNALAGAKEETRAALLAGYLRLCSACGWRGPSAEAFSAILAKFKEDLC